MLLTLLLAPALNVGTSIRHAYRHRTSLVRSRIESGSTSKGMAKVALVELGSGCCHNTNSTKAAIRACNNAIEWNSVKVTTIIPGGYDALRLHVQIGVPSPETVDLDAVARCFPYGQLLPVAVEEGGLLGSSRAGVPSDEPPEAKMVRPNQRCTSTSTGASTSTPPSTHAHAHPGQLSTYTPCRACLARRRRRPSRWRASRWATACRRPPRRTTGPQRQSGPPPPSKPPPPLPLRPIGRQTGRQRPRSARFRLERRCYGAASPGRRALCPSARR